MARRGTALLRALGAQLTLHGWRGVLGRLPHYLRRRDRWARLWAEGAADAAPPQPGPRAPARLHPELEAEQLPLDARVSVVIPTLNAGAEFEALLSKLRQQCGVPPVELVIVDSGSRDDTLATARAHGARIVVLEPGTFSHSHARNVGADAASGEYLLFMVQDAYPIGDRWLEGMLRFVIEHRAERVVAVSCAEATRLDSEFFYDWGARSHYEFLGCEGSDRIGALLAEDHETMRRTAQLSDIACLIGRDVFMRHRFRGAYAEDLDLGVRLLRAGERVALLDSVRVLHSHHRRALYYLKRGFVDVVFLRSVFADFPLPSTSTLDSLLATAQALRERVGSGAADLLHGQARPDPARHVERWLDRRPFDLARPLPPAADAPSGGAPPQDDSLDAFFAAFGEPVAANAPVDTAFAEDVAARCRHLQRGLQAGAIGWSPRTARETADALHKAFAAALGAALAARWWALRERDAADAERVRLDAISAWLRAGV